MQFTEYFSKGPWEPVPIASVVGGNRFAYDTLRMHADVSKVIPKMDCFRDIFGRVIAESTADKSRGRAEGYEESGQGRAGHRYASMSSRLLRPQRP